MFTKLLVDDVLPRSIGPSTILNRDSYPIRLPLSKSKIRFDPKSLCIYKTDVALEVRSLSSEKEFKVEGGQERRNRSNPRYSVIIFVK